MKVHVKKNDNVMVISGKDKGKISEVIAVYPKVGKVLIRDVNVVKKHKKPSKTNMEGGIVETEAAINSAKVMLYCDKCKSVTRIAKKITEDGTKVRVCKKCNEVL
ncbi:MAG: 50S ribosomal protein L24 [Clostridium sp.]|nr:50S ribosomal protein L24 [Clostridium sp.]